MESKGKEIAPEQSGAVLTEEKTLVQRLYEEKIVRNVLPDKYQYIMDKDERARWDKLIEFLYPVVESLFPGGWDFELYDSDKMVHGRLTLYYPKVWMTTENGDDYVINDLYVRLFFNPQLNLRVIMDGARSTLSTLEYLSGYSHSHLKFIEGFAPFCQGSTVLRDVLTRISANQQLVDYYGEPSDEDSAIILESLLHQVTAFVSHEASEGSPYYHIKDIGIGRDISVSQQVRDENYMRFKAFCLSNNYFPSLVLNGGQLQVRVNNTFEEVLLAMCTHTQYKDPDGKYYSELIIPSDIPEFNPDFRVFTFRGNTIAQKILPYEKRKEEEKDTRKAYCHHSIKDYILERLHEDFKTKIIENAKRELYTPAGSDSRGTSPGGRKAINKSRRMLKSLVPISQNEQSGVVGGDIL